MFDESGFSPVVELLFALDVSALQGVLYAMSGWSMLIAYCAVFLHISRLTPLNVPSTALISMSAASADLDPPMLISQQQSLAILLISSGYAGAAEILLSTPQIG